MRVLLTGATGFIGRHALPKLAERHQVTALARGAPPADLVDQAEWLTMDLAAPVDASALPRQIDAVVHLAQSARYREFPEGAADIFAVNVQSTAALLEYARTAGASCFVYASSGGIYSRASEPLTEADPAAPSSFYLSSKYVGELLLDSYRTLLRTVALRFFFVYGPGQTGMLIPTLAEKVRRGEPIAIEGDPGLRSNPIYVGDAVQVLEPALDGAGEGPFNVAGSEAASVSELVAILGEEAGREALVTHNPAGLDGDLVADISRMRDVLGVVPQTSLRDGLSEVLTAMRAASA